MNNGVTFRRINGHIVPLKINEAQHNQVKQGAIEVAAGVGAGAATGAVTAKVVQKASKFYVKSRQDFKAGKRVINTMKAGQMSFNDFKNIKDAEKTINKSVNLRKQAVSLFRSRNKILGAGVAVTAALIGSGVHKINQAMHNNMNNKNEPKESLQSAVKKSAVIGAIAAGATYAGYYAHLPVGNPIKVLSNVVARMAGKRRPFQASWW